MRNVVAALVLVVFSGVAGAGDLENSSFESGEEAWQTLRGSTLGESGPANEVAIDRTVARGGKASLRMRGDESTIMWDGRYQQMDARPGERISLRVAVRCENVRHEGRQYRNANAALIYENDDGTRLAFETTTLFSGTREWFDLGLESFVPDGATRVKVFLFLSQSGTAWFDDVRVRVAPATADTREGREAAFDALAWHLERTYPFWGLGERPEPAELFAETREACVSAASATAFHDRVLGMLGHLRDVHVSCTYFDGSVGSGGPSWAPSVDPGFGVGAALRRLRTKTQHGRNVLAGWLTDAEPRLGYLLIGTLAPDEKDRKLISEALSELAEADGIVIDLRANGGGDENYAATIMGRFCDEKVVYAQHRFRDPTLPGHDEFGPVVRRVLEPSAEQDRIPCEVVLLQGPGCVSSTEGMLLMGKALPRVSCVGQPSRGASANPAQFRVSARIVANLSRWQSLDLDGKLIEDVGVAPDVAVEPAPPLMRMKDDPALDRAIDLLTR